MKRLACSLRVGSWRPAVLEPGDVVTVKLLLALSALIHAGIYGVHMFYGGVAEWDRYVPVWVWFAMCLAAGVSLIAGVASRTHWLVWVGHSFGGTAYAALTIATAQEAIASPDVDDWRYIGPLAVATLMHMLFWLRSGPRPIPPADETTREVVIGPSA